jgi:hypothetical protein
MDEKKRKSEKTANRIFISTAWALFCFAFSAIITMSFPVHLTGEFPDTTWVWPKRLACIGIFSIGMIFIWKPFSLKVRRIAAL